MELYNKLEKYVLKKDKKIIRNFFKKCISFKLNKRIMFCAKRNFTILEKRKYGLHIRLVPIEEKDSILSVVGRGEYETLCRYFNVKNESDIDLIIPLIKESFKKSGYVAIDNKLGLSKFYVE